MSICQVCGKGPKAGNNRSHSMRATKRTFKPNILNKNLDLGEGLKVRVKMCAKCYKTMSNKGGI